MPDIAVGEGSAGPFTYHPERVLLIADGEAGNDELEALGARGVEAVTSLLDRKVGVQPEPRNGFVVLHFDGSIDAPLLSRQLREAAIPASVDVAYMIDAFTATPMTFNGTYLANPMTFNGAYYAAPMTFNGEVVSDPMTFNRRSTARPYAPLPPPFASKLAAGTGVPVVAVLDTGYPAGTTGDGAWVPLSKDIVELPDPEGDRILDPAAGHNGFIQAIVHQGAPKTVLRGLHAVSNDGVGYESDIADQLVLIHREWRKAGVLDHAILNCSFSGYYEDDTPPPLVADRIRNLVDDGVVVVASAGNDGSCRRTFPAAMCEVIGVGSVGGDGPSWFSNHGPWVDASAPGEDVVSRFFPKWDGGFDPPLGTDLPDPDDFKGWAMWTGTSFAAPRVVAALARQIQLRRCTGEVAVELVLGRPGLFRLPDYGIVVNQGF